MKKIRPLTLLTTLASLVKLTDRKMGRDLSNDKSLTCGQKKFVAGCGLYRPDGLGTQTVTELNNGTSSLVTGGTGSKKPAMKCVFLHTIDNNICSTISGGGTPFKPPRVARLDIPPKYTEESSQG